MHALFDPPLTGGVGIAMKQEDGQRLDIDLQQVGDRFMDRTFVQGRNK